MALAAKPKLVYEPSPKHCEPITAQRPGSKCPGWSVGVANELLDGSEVVGKKRFATRDGVAFVGQITRSTDDEQLWHGYPEAWDRVPSELKRKWKDKELITRKDLKRLRTQADIIRAFGGKP